MVEFRNEPNADGGTTAVASKRGPGRPKGSYKPRRPLPDPELLDTNAVAALLSVCPRTVLNMRIDKSMPAALRLGGNIRWRRSDIDQWIADGCPEMRDAVKSA